jgi:curved DNA-binding protein CbpA
MEFSFELAPNVDITKLPLTTEEGFVVSRMLGRRMTISDLQREASLNAQKAGDVVESLIRKGAIVRVGGSKSNEPYDGVVFSPADLHEAADLTEDQRKRILFVEMNLEKWSSYKLLGLKRTSTPADIKAGYFKSSKEFHPDAYFRKNLGSYKDRIDKIFRAMKSAYDVLSDPQRRTQYDATAVIELTPEEEAELTKLAEKKREEMLAKERDARNEQRMREARLKRNPMTDRIKRGRDYLKLADDAYAAGRLDEAANHARLAVSFDEGLKARADKYVLEASRGRAGQMMKRVQQILASPTDTKELSAELNRVADEAADIAAATADKELLVDVARVMLTLKRPVRAAKLAQQATEVDGRNPKAWEALAEAAFADSKWAILQRAADRWLSLEPKAARAKELSKEAKRNS